GRALGRGDAVGGQQAGGARVQGRLRGRGVDVLQHADQRSAGRGGLDRPVHPDDQRGGVAGGDPRSASASQPGSTPSAGPPSSRRAASLSRTTRPDGPTVSAAKGAPRSAESSTSRRSPSSSVTVITPRPAGSASLPALERA